MGLNSLKNSQILWNVFIRKKNVTQSEIKYESNRDILTVL